eukprot:scaffold92892_cov19-Prasinocladus_malaysianus.AAC.2
MSPRIAGGFALQGDIHTCISDHHIADGGCCFSMSQQAGRHDSTDYSCVVSAACDPEGRTTGAYNTGASDGLTHYAPCRANKTSAGWSQSSPELSV